MATEVISNHVIQLGNSASVQEGFPLHGKVNLAHRRPSSVFGLDDLAIVPSGEVEVNPGRGHQRLVIMGEANPGRLNENEIVFLSGRRGGEKDQVSLGEARGVDFVEEVLKPDILSIAPKGFDWQEFVESAPGVWQECVPQSGFLEVPAPTEEELPGLVWSDLVPEKLQGPRLIEHIKTAWDVQQAFLRGEVNLHPCVATVGPMGVGKSELAEALYGYDPLSSTLYPEKWKDNSNLWLFYQQLAVLMSPEVQQSSFWEEQLAYVQRIQALVQSHFASLKFDEELRAMEELTRRRVIRDVNLGQDFVYNQNQANLGLASEEGQDKYLADNRQRQRLLPPYLRLPIIVYPHVEFEIVRERVLRRDRAFEEKVPSGYLEGLHLNTAQWVLAMQEAGATIIAVDARTDFREFKPDREPTAELVWREVEKAHGLLLERFRQGRKR